MSHLCAPHFAAIVRSSHRSCITVPSRRNQLCMMKYFDILLSGVLTLYAGAESFLRTKNIPGLTVREREVFSHLDARRLPHHVAIIMDGNGRWAKRRHLPRIAGHKRGVEAVRSVATTAARIGIPWLTLYAFSVENWKRRPKTEVSFLMGLLKTYLKHEVSTFREHNIQLQ